MTSRGNGEGIVLVSGVNAPYFPLLQNLLGSVLGPARAQGIDVAVLDLGLTEAQRKELKALGVAVRLPKWDYDVHLFKDRPPTFFKAMTARPHLPRHLPGYRLYLWLDADCWVQDWDAISLYLESAERVGFAVTPEIDRAYTPFMANGAVLDWVFSCYARCFGQAEAARYVHYPLINSGIFAARADAPHWSLWSAALGAALKTLREPYFFSEQTALNHAIRANALPTAWLPSRCNWVCGRALPATSDGIVLCDPNPPHERLGIIHLTAGSKNGRRAIAVLNGGSVERSLRHNGHDPEQVGPDVSRE